MFKKKINIALIVVIFISFVVMLYGAYIIYEYDEKIIETAYIVENKIDGDVVNGIKEDAVSAVQEVEKILKKEVYTDAIGIITFESGEKVAIYEGITDNHLNIGAGKITNDAVLNERGNSILLGHRDGSFAVLKSVSIGDEFEVKTRNLVSRYKVSKTYVTEKDDLTPYEDSEKIMITLITCYPFIYLGDAQQRYAVVAELI